MLAGIIIDEHFEVPGNAQDRVRMGTRHTPWAHVEVLGKPAMHRFRDSLCERGCESISIAVRQSESGDKKDEPTEPTIDFVAERVSNFRRQGFETVLIARFGAYVEFDLEEMLDVHQEQGKGVTRLASEQDPLDIWMVDISCLGDDESILPALQISNQAVYRSKAYVNPLKSARDLRRLVLDSFNCQCRLKPQGSELRPGVWVNEGAQIERTARIVAPAFIGAGVQVSEECLVTRCSNIEAASFVDFGTAVEDSSILPNTYLGIGLDLSHSVIDGRNLFNLRHDVVLDITDPVVMRPNMKSEVNRRSWPSIERRDLALTAE